MRETIYEGTATRKARGEWEAFLVWDNPQRVNLADESRFQAYCDCMRLYGGAVVEFIFVESTEAES